MSDKTEIIELLIPEHELLTFAMLAHESGITLNEWFMRALRARLEKDNGEANSNKQGTKAEGT